MNASLKAPVIVFDVNETLLDLAHLEPLFTRLFSDPSALRAWFDQLILQSQAISLSGLYIRFDMLAAGVLEMLGRMRSRPVAAADIEEMKARLRAMPAHADAAPALAALREAGFRLVTLTNSPPSAPPSPLEKAGLSTYFDKSYSVDTVRRFKPAPQTYSMVAEAEGVALSDLCLVACHVWDTIGAQAAGCKAALVTRPGNAELLADGLPVAEVVGPDLGAVAAGIIDLWGRG